MDNISKLLRHLDTHLNSHTAVSIPFKCCSCLDSQEICQSLQEIILHYQTHKRPYISIVLVLTLGHNSEDRMAGVIYSQEEACNDLCEDIADSNNSGDEPPQQAPYDGEDDSSSSSSNDSSSNNSSSSGDEQDSLNDEEHERVDILQFEILIQKSSPVSGVKSS